MATMNIAEKLSRSYIDDILKRKERYFKERDERIRDEQLRLKELDEIAEKEKKDEIERKRFVNNMQYEDMKRNQELNKLKQQKLFYERMTPVPVSLEINNEDSMNRYHNYIQRLSDKVDSNAMRFEDYHRRHSNNSSNVLNRSAMNPRFKDISEVYGIRREPTDITDKTIFDRHNNKDYVDYKEKNREYCDYNKSLMNIADKEREDLMMRKILLESQRNIQNRNYYDKVEIEAKMYENEKKRQYKEMLDEQRRNQVVEKLSNENFTVDAVNINPQYYKEVDVDNSYKLNKSFSVGNYRMKSPDHSFINKNKFVEVNPYNKHKYNLGSSLLDNNPILNPKIDYKFNKYMFPEMRSASPFTRVGYSIAK